MKREDLVVDLMRKNISIPILKSCLRTVTLFMPILSVL